MPDLPDILPARRDDLEIAVFDDGFVVFDPVHRLSHHLDGVTAAVFDACDGHTATEALIAEAAELGADPERVRASTAFALAQFGALAILEGSELSTDAPPPCIGCGKPARRGRRRP